MATRPVVIVVICVGLFIIIDSLVPKVMAIRPSNINDFRMEDQRSNRRRNYILQRARDKEILGNLENIPHDADPRNPEELSAFIVDYANMIDNVILLDKSVETRTRKRGNIKLQKLNLDNQVIPDLPCACKPSEKLEELGENVFPKTVDTKVCGNNHGCAVSYICQEINFDMPILRKRESRTEDSHTNLLPELNMDARWVVEFKKVSVGCQCIRDYTQKMD